MAQFERHVFVCSNTRPAGHPRGCCAARGGDAVREAFKNALKARGLSKRIRTNQCGCLDQCEHGVTAVVYPEQVWYGFLKPDDVATIVEEHLIGGRPVERLRLADGCVNAAACPHKAVPAPPA